MKTLEEALDRFSRNKLTKKDVLQILAQSKTLQIGEALLDTDRLQRKGFPEVILAQGKRTEDIVCIMRNLIEKRLPALASRVSEEQAEVLVNEFAPDGSWRPKARLFIAKPCPIQQSVHSTEIAVLTAGLSDLTVAEEAAQILEIANYPIRRIYDVGVSGLHRLLGKLNEVLNCEVVIVVSGMEGTMPSIVAGLVEQPVIAVPTSNGYGISSDGTTPLHTMLASCSPGLSVVNINNGYGAAMAAHAICLRVSKARNK